ncbi:MAG: hypothetical protein AAFZ80_07305 [Cyanobacteria bacterium P01_A01_bin.105]
MYAALNLLHVLLLWLFHWLQPYLTFVCLLLAWGLVIMVVWQIFAAARDGLNQAKTLHQIPCADCRFFTNSHHLKCPVHPTAALTPTAIGCGDFEFADAMQAAIQRQKADGILGGYSSAQSAMNR